MAQGTRRADEMTAADWLATTEPNTLLDFLHEAGRESDRKMRLFAVACCRRVWHLLTRHSIQRVVEVAELHAEGAASHEDVAAAWANMMTSLLPRGAGCSAAFEMLVPA